MDPNKAPENNQGENYDNIEIGIQAMRREITKLRAQNAQQHEIINMRNKDILSLRNSLEILSRNNYNAIDPEDKKDSNEVGDGDVPVLLEPIFDENDGVYRCCECCSEVVCGFCAACTLEHEYESDEDEMDKERSISTDDTLVRSARVLAPRGTTPLRLFHEDDTPPATFAGDAEEYIALLQRGATRLMISTFHLSFDDNTGITAWADSEMYQAWATPTMRAGDFWKIMLGRIIALDADDLDGSIWLEEFLEDIMLSMGDTWETVQERPGIWVTRPAECTPAIKVPDNNDNTNDGSTKSKTDEGDPIQWQDNYEEDSEAGSPIAFAMDTESETGTEKDALLAEDELSLPPLKGSDAIVIDGIDWSDDDVDQLDSDIPGSDWDSQEELSGDEEVLGHLVGQGKIDEEVTGYRMEVYTRATVSTVDIRWFVSI